MVHHATILYPNDEGIQFNETYYVETHMRTVESTLKKHGLLSWKVIKYSAALDGSPSRFLISTQMEFENAEALQAAFQDPETPKIFADVPNFTNAKPITLAGAQL
ncbi:hypothetical protein BJX76DRAFT_320380 [Aspergillus varians]